MSAWPPQSGVVSRWRPATAEPVPSTRQLRLRTTIWLGGLVCILVIEGAAITHSYLWAAPLACLLVVAVAVDIPLVPFLGLTLLVRILSDATLSGAGNRHTGSVNISGGIAVLFILMALGLLIRRRQGVWPAVLITLWLCLWTAIAVNSHGASTVTIREGVREASIVAIAVIVYNSRGVLNISVVTRLIQIAGFASALLALYQLATHTGLDIAGQVRANGTFAQPNGAAMYFAIATTASLWQYVDNGRRRIDMLLVVLFAAAAIATFSLGGLASLLVMLVVFGTLRPGSLQLKLGAYATAGLIAIAFLSTPLGGERIATETSTHFSTSRPGLEASTSLGWRFYKWSTLIPEWERAPYFGQGLGTTVSVEGTSENETATAGKVPHSEFVRYLVETGIVGLAILLWATAILISRLAQRRRFSSTRNAWALGLAIVAGCLVDALGDNTFLYSTTSYAAALIVASILSVSRTTTAAPTTTT